MEMLLDHFPVFEANQVLTSGHLNDVVDYLDQQERQTRSHLIGIGIVCGLEIKLAGDTIELSRGCGVTSEGYLIVEPTDLKLTAYRSYTPPADIDYPPFTSGTGKYALWELFEDHVPSVPSVPNTTALSTPAGFLDDKAVMLFLELKREGLRNCSPNNCDDKGSQVIATVRRLLIATSDLDKIIAAANALDSGLTASDIDNVLATRLNLPDLRLRRFDVINSGLVTSNDVYIAFLDMVRTGGLAKTCAQALSAAYAAFAPLLVATYPSDPFANFSASYGFLDSAPANVTQATFLQYYTDLVDDLLRAYDEFRWKGLELICACCPDDGLFPRHLMLGLLNPGTVAAPGHYRQDFLASPATSDCTSETREVVQLFSRLVEMAARFTDTPALPKANPKAPIDPQIRITPSRQGCCDDALEQRAIPYYYAQNGTPPLYQLWSPTKTRRKRANQNFSYNADLYANPPAPAFVTDPLRYDIEPSNFLRIEGHLGKDYRDVLRSLLTLKSQYRLPIDIIALRTGGYDESQPVDLSKETARFQDLEALYASLRGDLMSELAEGVMQLYDKTIPPVEGLTLSPGTPKLPLLVQYAPHYSYPANTVGSWYEQYLTQFENQAYLDVNQNAINPSAVMLVYCVLFNGTQRPDASVFPDVVAIYYISKLSEILPAKLDALNYADFENKYQDLMALIRFFRSSAIADVTPDLKNFLPEEEFIDFCEGVLFGCKLDAVKAVHDDYVARIGDLKKRQFLSNFLQAHPGIQHKAGAPIGGTFILVYHGNPAPSGVTTNISVNIGLLHQLEQAATAKPLATAAVAEGAAKLTSATMMVESASNATSSMGAFDAAHTATVATVINNISANRQLIQDDNVSQLIGWLTGQVPITGTGGSGPPAVVDPAAKIIGTTVGGLTSGTVIADFFLPYQISSGLPGTEYVLPKAPPAFTATIGCTAADGNATVTIDAKGGVPPYDVAVDGGAYQALGGPLQLATGDHSIMLRGADATETPVQKITVPPPIVIGTPTYACADDGTYRATASITGGTPPYQVDGKPAPDAVIVTDPTASGTTVSTTVTDAKGCTATAQFNHTCPPPCTLPCAGIALNRDYRFFLPDAQPNNPYRSFKRGGVTFTVESAPGKSIDLSAQVTKILVATQAQLSAANFPATVNGWIKEINNLIAGTAELNQAGKAQWLTLGYKPSAPGALGLLTIEYFRCLSFNFQIDVTYARESGISSTRTTYTPAQTVIQVGDSIVTVPAFDGTTTDKCAADPVTANLCPVTPEFTVKVDGAASAAVNAQLTLNAAASVPADGLTFVWEAQDGTPAMANGQKFTVQFATPGPKLVTVTAFNAKGCSASTSLTIKVG